MVLSRFGTNYYSSKKILLSLQPGIILRCLYIYWERNSCSISTVVINERRLFWGTILDLKVVMTCDTPILMVITIIIIIINMEIHVDAQYIQQDDSSSGLGDCVDAVCICRVVVWVGWRGQDAIWGCETAPTCTNSVGHLWSHICWLIFKLKSKATRKRVGKESAN